MNFAQLNILDYLTMSAGRKIGSPDINLKYLLERQANIYGLKENAEVISYIIVSPNGEEYSLVYIETEKELRHKGYATQLLNSFLEAIGGKLFVDTSSDHPYRRILLQLMEKVGFRYLSTSRTFSVDCDAHNKAIFFNEGGGISKCELATNRLLRGGKQCLPLSNLSQEQFELFRKAENHKFNPTVFLDNHELNLDKNLSYVVFDQNELVAYTLLTRISSEHIVIERFSTLLSRLHSGIIIAPFFYSISAVIRLYYPTVTRIFFKINNNNKDAFKTFTHLMTGLNYSEYCYDTFCVDKG